MREPAFVRIATTPDNRVSVSVTLPAGLEALPLDERRRVVEEAAERVAGGSLARLDRMAHPSRPRQLARMT